MAGELIRFGSLRIIDRDAKKRALEEFYGDEVPDSLIDRVVVRTIGNESIILSVN